MLNTARSSAQLFLALHPPLNFLRMTNNISPSTMAKRLEAEINMILRRVDQPKLDEKPRSAVAKLRQSLIDAKIYIRDYELSEMRDEQLKSAKTGKKWLEQARQAMLKASEYNVFGAIDVAHLSAQIDQIIGDLK
jgi:hypothetical protein